MRRIVRNAFHAVYDEHRELDGEPFTVLEHVTEPRERYDAEALPVYRIRFIDGTEIDAWPEEVEHGAAGT